VVTWIVLGTVALGVAVLWVSVVAVLNRLRPLRRAVRRLALRAEQAERLQTRLDELNDRLARLDDPLAEAALRSRGLTGRNGAADVGH
jgi:HAMP domain-containing protein